MLFILFLYLLLTYMGATDLIVPIYLKIIAGAAILESAIFEIILWDNVKHSISKRSREDRESEEL